MTFIKEASDDKNLEFTIYIYGKDGVNGSSPLVGSRNSKGSEKFSESFFIFYPPNILQIYFSYVD